MPDDAETFELTLLVWAAWGFVALMGLALVALLVAGWWFVSRPVFVDFARARADGDLWRPFLRDERGEWRRLVSSHQQAVFRADAPGSDTNLWLRWGPLLGLHGALTLMLVAVPLWAVVAVARQTCGA